MASDVESSSDVQPSYQVVLTDEAVYAYTEVRPADIYERTGILISQLSTYPYYGRVYDSSYTAALPNVTSRVLYCGNYGVYYHVSEERQVVTVFAIEDQRRDPFARFV